MKKIGNVLIILVILVFNFVIGANEKGLRVLEISVLLTLILAYLIFVKIKNPKSSIFVKNKIDFFVFIFMITTTLPLIFHTYCSYSDNIEFILKYFFIYSVYLLARNTIESKEQIELIINATLICSLIPLIIGFDEIYGKYLEFIVNNLNLTYINNKMFAGTFGYANAVAIYMSFCIFLAIHKVKNTSQIKYKIIYFVYIAIAGYVIWKTLSRSIMALLLLILSAYFIIAYRKQIMNHWKKIVAIMSIVFVVFIPALIYALGVSTPMTITDRQYWHRMKYQFTPETRYTIELELEAQEKRKDLQDLFFEVDIIQGNKYFKEETILAKRFGDINGILKLEFTPDKDYSYINIKFINDFRGEIVLKKCFINGKEYIINYKYLPHSIGKIFSEYSLNEKSLRERGYIYSSCIKLASQSPLIGQGGNTWTVLSETVQEYTGQLKESHSYFFELLISYGVLGVLSFLMAVGLLFIKLVKQFKNDKNQRNDKLLIFIGLFFLLIHSITFDFNMSFMLIQLIVYIYMAILLYDYSEEFYNFKYVDYGVIAILVCVLITCYRADVAEYCTDNYEIKHNVLSYKAEYAYYDIAEKCADDYDNFLVLNQILEFMNKEPYTKQTQVFRFYFEQLSKYKNELSDEELEKYLTIGISKLKNVKIAKPLYANEIFDRTRIIATVIKDFESYGEITNEREVIIENAITELKKIVNDTFETNKNIIENSAINGEDEYSIQLICSQYVNLVNSIEGREAK